jgi:hypothetical protein
MKSIFLIALTMSLGACSLLQPKPEPAPIVRESFNPCPFMVDGVNHPNCPKSGAAKGGICLPSGELHSVPEKCDKVK